jgi:D-aspartate ligase
MAKSTAFVISHEPSPARAESDKAMSIIALTLTRALGRENIDVVRVHPNHLDYSLLSKYCNSIEISPNCCDSEDALTKFLLELAEKYSGQRVLIPASDDCSLYLAKHEDELSKKFILSNPSARSMERMNNKRLQYELAADVGVPIPETYFPKSYQEVVELSKQLRDFPYIIKPLEAQKWRLDKYSVVTDGKKAIEVNTGQELIDQYKRIATHDTCLMIQEVIAGRDEHLYTFLAYCSMDVKPLAYCIRSKLRQSPVDFGYCTATVSCHNDTVDDYGRRLLRESDYVGIVGIEFKYDERSDSYKLIEINTRPVNTTGLAIGCGVNLPVIAYRDAIGDQPHAVTDWKDGIIWIRLIQDFAAAREWRRRGLLTYFQWFKSIRGERVHAIFATDDLLVEYYVGFLKGQVLKVVKFGRIPDLIRKMRRSLHRVYEWIW